MIVHDLPADRADDWRAAGFQARDFFPSRAVYLHKAAPDGFKLAARSGLDPQPGEMWEVVLYALPPALDGLPPELFFDDDLMWHGQHFGRPGQVGVASVHLRGSEIHTAVHHSDLVQRISRRREHKTRVEGRFRGWDRLLLNAVLDFALDRGVTTVRVPTAEYARGQTDADRAVGPELFDRIYDRHVVDTFVVTRDRHWWLLDVATNRDRIVRATARTEPSTTTKAICVCHDIERGLGHRTFEPSFAAAADRDAATNLATMTDTEDARGVAATYNVVGAILPEVRAGIGPEHCLGFHTYDHHVDRRGDRVRSIAARRLRIGTVPGTPGRLQLARCRGVDYRIKGYRPAQSRLGADTDAAALAHQSFEWLASSSRSLGITEPTMVDGIARIPIAFDDFALHRGMPYDEWEARAFERARAEPFLAFSLHDCYGPTWLPHYDSFLGRLVDTAETTTLDRVAAEVTLADAR